MENYDQELKHNGYILSKGKQLKNLKLQFGHVINVPSKTTQLGLFNFRAFLNLGMLYELYLQNSPNYLINLQSLMPMVKIFRTIERSDNWSIIFSQSVLLAEGENAKLLRSKMLDIVIETINKRTGGGTKYINRKGSGYLPTAIRESKYRKELPPQVFVCQFVCRNKKNHSQNLCKWLILRLPLLDLSAAADSDLLIIFQ